MSILNDIYNGRYEVDRPPTADYQALCRELEEMWKQVEAAVGLELVDKLQAKEADLWEQHEEQAFRGGFRLGAGLMAELL